MIGLSCVDVFAARILLACALHLSICVYVEDQFNGCAWRSGGCAWLLDSVMLPALCLWTCGLTMLCE
jgi:hypothetical protein